MKISKEEINQIRQSFILQSNVTFVLLKFLETTLKERDKRGSFHVSQAILTPRVNTVAKGLVWGLRNYLVERSANASHCFQVSLSLVE